MSFGSPYFTLPEFEYMKPSTLEEALGLLDSHGDEAKVMAGGVGLLAFMKERLMEPKYVIDIKGLKPLQILQYQRGKGLTIGATVTLNQILSYPQIRQRYVALHQAIATLSDTVLRNRSTLVGDLCEALPFVDSPAPLMVFDAEVEVVCVAGARRIPVREFIVGPAQTALRPNELVAAVHLPEPPPAAKSGFLKHAIGGEFSIVNVAALVANPHVHKRRDVRLVYGAATPVPIRVTEAEAVFKRNQPVDQLVADAVSIVLKQLSPMTDALATAEFRQHLIELMSWKLLNELFGR